VITRLILLGLALWLPGASCLAAPIRVTTWDLQPVTNGWSKESQANLVKEAAEALKKLHPDVILLQQAPDWETCRQLAHALQPETYQAAVCSSFRDPRARHLSGQAAILSKAKAYFAWAEPWRNIGESPVAQGGFAFAAIRLGDKNVGFFSVQVNDGAASNAADNTGAALQQASDESARQLVRQIDLLQNWRSNRLEAFVVAGEFSANLDDLRLVHEQTLPRLEQIGFENALAGAPLEKRITPPSDAGSAPATLDCFFTRDAGLVFSPVVTSCGLTEHKAMTWKMDLTAPKLLPAARAEGPPSTPAANPAQQSTENLQYLLWFAGFLGVGLAVLLLARKLARRSELPPASATLPGLEAKTVVSIATPQADQVVVAPPSKPQPYVHIEMEGSTQTQSQTWRPRPDVGGPSARMPAAVRAGVIANLSWWFRQKVVQRLVSDRAQLLATQQAAANKMVAVDERLARIERQIRQINQEYEQRIDVLLKELITAKEENRELIRAKIALVKAEMEKARMGAGQHAKQHQQS
jgi:hypothetical protein